jgi:hypothetical protein
MSEPPSAQSPDLEALSGPKPTVGLNADALKYYSVHVLVVKKGDQGLQPKYSAEIMVQLTQRKVDAMWGQRGVSFLPLGGGQRELLKIRAAHDVAKDVVQYKHGFEAVSFRFAHHELSAPATVPKAKEIYDLPDGVTAWLISEKLY